MNVKYCGPARDYSGYGEANRHDIGALLSVGVDVTTQIPVYSLELSDFGMLGERCVDRENKKIPYDIKILHTTPNVYRQFMEPGKYHIGRVFWETDKIPSDFAKNVELVDEIWTGSRYNEQAIRNAGVTKPIYIVPEAIDTNIGIIEPYQVDNGSTYRFYSIFEWTERKNPAALLRAYWKEFQNDEPVSLTIKTYVDNFTTTKEREVLAEIHRIKKMLNLQKYPPLYLFTGLMDRHQVYRFHQSMQCFVSSHRGEGWGIPQMEAMTIGNPVISTNCGGIHEYMTDGVSAKLIPYRSVQIVENSRNKQWYTSDQNWAEVDEQALREALRWAYDNQQQAEQMGINGQIVAEDVLSLSAVGSVMKSRLEKIADEKGFCL